MNVAEKMIFWADDGMHVPNGYEIIEGLDLQSYSGSLSGAYVNTGLQFVPSNTNVEIYAILKPNSWTNQWNALFEVATDYIETANDECKVRIADNYRNWMTSNYDDDSATFQNVSWFQISYDEWHHISLHGHDFTVDGKTKYTSQTSNTLNQPLCIGCFDYKGSMAIGRVWPGIVGLCQVTENNKLIGQFVPVKETATGICGYYDTVSKKFLKSKSNVPFKEYKN